MKCEPVHIEVVWQQLAEAYGQSSGAIRKTLGREGSFLAVAHIDAADNFRRRFRRMPGPDSWGRFSYSRYFVIDAGGQFRSSED